MDAIVAAALAVAPPQQQAHAGQQLRRLKGLGQVIVRPLVQAPHPVAQLAPGGEHQHRQAAAGAPQPLQQGKAVQPRQHHVQHQQIVDPR